MSVKRYTGRFRVFYAQNREDLILKSFLPEIEGGFYVDVGANHPDLHSVTRLFYEEGWSGINIEPQSKALELFNKKRKRDVNMCVAAGSSVAEMDLTIYPNGDGLSTMSDSMIEQYDGSDKKEVSNPITKKVKVLPLSEILRMSGRKDRVDFLKIDVEGFEYEVLAGNDWEKCSPRLICIEANHVDKDWRPMLDKLNYSFAFFDGLNEYYLASDEAYRLEDFKKENFIKFGMSELSIYSLAGEEVHRLTKKEQQEIRKSDALNFKELKKLLELERDDLRKELNDTLNSRSYKVGSLISGPYRKLLAWKNR